MMNHTFQFITSIKKISKEHTPPKNLYKYAKYQRTKSLIRNIINLVKHLKPKRKFSKSSTPLLKILSFKIKGLFYPEGFRGYSRGTTAQGTKILGASIFFT
jgi:hypothetical protein